MTHFTGLGLEPRLLKALAQEGYETPTPIQTQSIPHILSGKDLLGIAQTGTGKTAAFALPILQRLAADKRLPNPKTARALILSPTRELALQIAESFRAYGRYMNLSVTTIFGGVGEGPQIQTMKRGIDILVATPGRLLDHVRQRNVTLGQTEILVLDEADRMLDMGFINDIRKLVATLPGQRQNLFFSATMPAEIASLAAHMLRDPMKVSVTPQATTVEKVDQRVILVDTVDKRALLAEILRGEKDIGRTLVFTRTKHGADKVVRHLEGAGIAAAAIHGNKSQSQRVSALNAFRAGRARVLIATDIAARGIDVDDITHVINFDLPHVAESYVHRIGRTARAGAAGIAISFCDREERPLLRDIEKLTRQTIAATDRRGHHARPVNTVPVEHTPQTTSWTPPIGVVPEMAGEGGAQAERQPRHNRERNGRRPQRPPHANEHRGGRNGHANGEARGRGEGKAPAAAASEHRGGRNAHANGEPRVRSDGHAPAAANEHRGGRNAHANGAPHARNAGHAPAAAAGEHPRAPKHGAHRNEQKPKPHHEARGGHAAAPSGKQPHRKGPPPSHNGNGKSHAPRQHQDGTTKMPNFLTRQSRPGQH